MKPHYLNKIRLKIRLKRTVKMGKDSMIYVYNSFQNPVELDYNNDKLVIDCPTGKVEVTLARIMRLIARYGVTSHDALEINGETVLVNNNYGV